MINNKFNLFLWIEKNRLDRNLNVKINFDKKLKNDKQKKKNVFQHLVIQDTRYSFYLHTHSHVYKLNVGTLGPSSLIGANWDEPPLILLVALAWEEATIAYHCDMHTYCEISIWFILKSFYFVMVLNCVLKDGKHK